MAARQNIISGKLVRIVLWLIIWAVLVWVSPLWLLLPIAALFDAIGLRSDTPAVILSAVILLSLMWLTFPLAKRTKRENMKA